VTSTSVLPKSQKATKPGRCGAVPCVDGTVVDEVDAGRDELDAEEAVPRVPGLHVDAHLCAAWHILQQQETAFLGPNLLWIRFRKWTVNEKMESIFDPNAIGWPV
jgi:hypothetical protein